MGIIKVEKVNLVDEVYKQIREQIVSGNWQEGEKIASENELTRSFEVSRVVIREALQRLRSERYIITKQGIGSFVTNPENYGEPEATICLSERTYEQLVQFREAIEYTAVRLSPVYGTKEDYERVLGCAQRMRETADDLLSFSKADYEFHYAVVLCAHNDLLEQAMSSCRKIIFQILKEMNRVPKSREFGIEAHHQIAEAICMKNVERAIAVYEKNSRYNTVRLAEFYAEENKDGQKTPKKMVREEAIGK